MNARPDRGPQSSDGLDRPELRLTRQRVALEAARLADVVVWMGETAMCALAIRDDISPEEPCRRARQEGDGRLAARPIDFIFVTTKNFFANMYPFLCPVSCRIR